MAVAALIEFAGNEFTLSAVQSDGSTLRDHLETVARSCGGRKPAELIELTSVKCPDVIRHVWNSFLELSCARGSNGFGPAAISYVEMQAWSKLTRKRLKSWHVEVIKRLDMIYLQAQAKKANRGKENG